MCRVFNAAQWFGIILTVNLLIFKIREVNFPTDVSSANAYETTLNL